MALQVSGTRSQVKLWAFVPLEGPGWLQHLLGLQLSLHSPVPFPARSRICRPGARSLPLPTPPQAASPGVASATTGCVASRSECSAVACAALSPFSRPVDCEQQYQEQEHTPKTRTLQCSPLSQGIMDEDLAVGSEDCPSKIDWSNLHICRVRAWRALAGGVMQKWKYTYRSRVCDISQCPSGRVR